MAAEVIAAAGVKVAVFDAMPSAGRKLLRAGIGGLNITHAEDDVTFISRYGDRTAHIAPMLAEFGAEQLREWVHSFGIETFVGSSQRVFPVDKKAAPLLRAWLQRLRGMGVELHTRWRWLGWQDNGDDSSSDNQLLQFQTPNGVQTISAQATVLAMGGASWPQLGSDGNWVQLLQQRGVSVAALQPSNCGFSVNWSEHFREHFDRQPVKSVRACFNVNSVNEDGTHLHNWHNGELMITAAGIEGGLIYAISAAAREHVNAHGSVTVWLDLNPSRSEAQLAARLAQPQGGRSLAKHLKDKAGIDGVKAGLLREFCNADVFGDSQQLAHAIKQLPLHLGQPFPIDRAISCAGGVRFEDMSADLMLQQLPGVFCAGEMLDWEAPTGGYLLTACFASGQVAGKGVVRYLANVE